MRWSKFLLFGLLILLGGAAVVWPRQQWHIAMQPAAPIPAAVEKATVRVAAIQCAPRLGKVLYNRELLTTLVTQAAAKGAKILVLPECAVQGYMDPAAGRKWAVRASQEDELDVSAVAEHVPGPATRYFGQLSKQLGVYLALPLIEAADEKYFNTLVLLDPNGEITAHHRKKALWAPGDGTWATAGERPAQVVATPYGRLGLMVCYDLHQMPKELKRARADIVLYAVGWYGPNPENFFGDVFPRLYVQPSGLAVVAANWSAEPRQDRWPGVGCSCVIDATGRVVAMASTAEGSEVVIADLPLPPRISVQEKE
ncbi:MAG TPA: carbon-nitrogen hydrolase family protein [Planctomycetota bacterium]|jgi:predicted amidohydrolase